MRVMTECVHKTLAVHFEHNAATGSAHCALGMGGAQVVQHATVETIYEIFFEH